MNLISDNIIAIGTAFYGRIRLKYASVHDFRGSASPNFPGYNLMEDICFSYELFNQLRWVNNLGGSGIPTSRGHSDYFEKRHTAGWRLKHFNHHQLKFIVDNSEASFLLLLATSLYQPRDDPWLSWEYSSRDVISFDVGRAVKQGLPTQEPLKIGQGKIVHES